MSDDDVTERARRIVSGAMFGLTTPMMVDAIVSDLAAAGLLVTPEHDAEVAEQVRAEFEDMEHCLSVLLCNLTGGLLSKTGYDVATMEQHIEDYFEREVVEPARAEAWGEGFRAGHRADHNPTWWPCNPYRTEPEP